MWYLFLFGVAAAIAFLIWDVRRKAAAREAASKRRFEEMFLAKSAAAPSAGATVAAAPVSAAGVGGAKPVAPAAPAAGRERFLGQQQTLIYRLLKASITDHEIFANVALISVVGGRNEQQVRRLAHYRVDFVVCDKAMQVVAVVEMEAGGEPQAAGDQRLRADSLKAAGIRLVRLNAAALPRRDEIRVLVCGQPASPG